MAKKQNHIQHYHYSERLGLPRKKSLTCHININTPGLSTSYLNYYDIVFLSSAFNYFAFAFGYGFGFLT